MIDVTMEHVVVFFGRVYLALGTNATSHFLAQVFFKTRLTFESLQPLIGFLEYLELSSTLVVVFGYSRNRNSPSWYHGHLTRPGGDLLLG